jgi:phosphoserine phosphatase RsbU/P
MMLASEISRIDKKQMNLENLNTTKTIKLQFLVFSGGIFFLYKLFMYSPDSIIAVIINALLVGLTAIALVLFIAEVIHSKPLNPMYLVIHLGILNVVIFMLITFSDSIFHGLSASPTNLVSSGVFYDIISFLYSIIILGSLAYIFLVFKELYFLKQKKNISTYFNTMVVFFVLASYSSLLKDLPDLSYIIDTFYIISVCLVVMNSIKISWIAFIVKKEKIALLIISIIIAILFVINLADGTGSGNSAQALLQFSPVLSGFLKLMMTYGAIYFSVLFFTTLFHIPTAEAFDRKAQEVTSLQYFSKLITQVLDFGDLAETVTEIAAKVCNADAAWIAWKEDKDYRILANKNIGYVDAESITSYAIENFYGKVPKDTIILNLEKYEKKSQLGEHYHNAAVAPLKAHNELKGYLLAAKKGSFIFDDEDKNAMDTFSDYASVSIENSRLLEESIEKERLEKELDVAREIQRKILPEKNPSNEKINISSVFIPAFEVGGDYYDFFEISEDKFGFVIADVSGKGISAAFVMAEIKGIFESLTKLMEGPKEILVKANQILKNTLDRKNFVSAAYGLIDLENGTLQIARAGHCPIILLRGDSVKNLRPSGLGLGLNFGPHFENTLEEIKVDLKENDTIILYTDGITEAKNRELEDFGYENFENILLANINSDVDKIAEKVISEITTFSQDNSQHDDITLVVLRWKQKIKNNGVEEWQISAPRLGT